MNLLFHETFHLLFSLLTGFIVWKIWSKIWASFLPALMGGLFIDLDHLLDYYLVLGFNFKIENILNGVYFSESGKAYVLFHGWEYVLTFITLVFMFKNKTAKSLFLALALGITLHLFIDMASYNVPMQKYSVFFRAGQGFSTKEITEERKINTSRTGSHGKNKKEEFQQVQGSEE